LLLREKVRDATVEWKAARAGLREDPRWKASRVLDDDVRRDQFDQHVQTLRQRKRRAFHALLDGTEGVTLASTWDDAGGDAPVSHLPTCLSFHGSLVRSLLRSYI
jgi:hypothetical protein